MNIRRLSRRRVDLGNNIELAWDAGEPPPPEAHEAENRDCVIDCIYFRWGTHEPAWRSQHHPHLLAWLAVLRGERG